MAIDLTDQIVSFLTPEITQKVSTSIGESQSATQKALGAIAPGLVAALANMASTPRGAEHVTRMLDDGKYDGSALGNLPSLLAGGSAPPVTMSESRGILGSLLGSKITIVTDLIARFAGVRPTSASSLLTVAVPLVMHVLGSQRASVGQSPSALASLLGEQRDLLDRWLPKSLAAPGWTTLAPRAPDVAATTVRATTTAWNWKLFLPLLIVAGLVLPAVVAWLAPLQSPSGPAIPGALTEVRLPSGVMLSVAEGSLPYSLSRWLADTTDTAIPRRFVFDNLTFETGSSRLTPESSATVNALVAIMTAYPNVAVRLEGYTDNTGDPVANQRLSLERADAVRSTMMTRGIAGQRIATAGHGPENPVASNDTEEGRARNRRTELVVMSR
jgi:outer membrane protein OmpA-like peptidoglycan-associated protein